MAPHDKNVIKEVEKIEGVSQVKWTGGEHLISSLILAQDERWRRA